MPTEQLSPEVVRNKFDDQCSEIVLSRLAGNSLINTKKKHKQMHTLLDRREVRISFSWNFTVVSSLKMAHLAVLIILGLLQYTQQLPTEQVQVKQGSEVDPARELNLDLLPSTTCGRYIQNRIVGGQNASLMEYPWMALLGYVGPAGTDLHCMGTLISARYVLTGATCVFRKVP